MDDVGIFKTAHYMNDRVHLTDIRKELVAKPLALACSLHKTCDIHKFDRCRCYLLGMIKLTELYDSLIRNRNDTDIRIDGCKWIVCRQRSCFGQ